MQLVLPCTFSHNSTSDHWPNGQKDGLQAGGKYRTRLRRDRETIANVSISPQPLLDKSGYYFKNDPKAGNPKGTKDSSAWAIGKATLSFTFWSFSAKRETEWLNLQVEKCKILLPERSSSNSVLSSTQNALCACLPFFEEKNKFRDKLQKNSKQLHCGWMKEMRERLVAWMINSFHEHQVCRCFKCLWMCTDSPQESFVQVLACSRHHRSVCLPSWKKCCLSGNTYTMHLRKSDRKTAFP